MYLNTLKQYRQEMYDCLLKAKDALFNTVDALSTETMAKSLPEVTQSLWFERDWSSVYEALEEENHALKKQLQTILGKMYDQFS